MKLKRLKIGRYKNISGCDVEFPQDPLIHAVIGSNGSGKSNLMEAILSILVGCYFEKAPPFDFVLTFVAQQREVSLQREGRRVLIEVDGQPMSLAHFARRLRDGQAQVFYPELTLVYYSGECTRVARLIRRYQIHFQQLTRNPDTDRYRPLFVHTSNDHAEVILLALFAHRHRELTDRLGVEHLFDVTIRVRSPAGFDPDRHEPKLWNSVGAIRRIVAALDETASVQDRPRAIPMIDEGLEQVASRRKAPVVVDERIYRFEDDGDNGIYKLAKRLELAGDNIFLALESLNARGMLRSVSFKLRGKHGSDAFSFDQLSEGEKQLLAVVGAIQLTNQRDNLILLDEPDTHLNPYWSWDYPSMLSEAFGPEQLPRSTVLMATHDPVMISGMLSEQVLLAQAGAPDQPVFARPYRNPRGQGVANLLCSAEFFGLPSSLDKETQKLLDERLAISTKQTLTPSDKARLRTLNKQLEMIPAGVSERDPAYVEFLREREGAKTS